MKTTMLKTRRAALLATAAVSTLATGLAWAGADAGADKLTLAAYTVTADPVTDALIAAHDYDAVITRLAPHGAAFATDEVAASTNLCVSYVAEHQVDQAQQACSEAVKLARNDRAGFTLADRREHQEALDLALANQATAEKLAR